MPPKPGHHGSLPAKPRIQPGKFTSSNDTGNVDTKMASLNITGGSVPPQSTEGSNHMTNTSVMSNQMNNQLTSSTGVSPAAVPSLRPRPQPKPTTTDDVIDRLKAVCNPADPTKLYQNLVKIGQG